ELLGREPIGVRDDFFALGGHSLLAVRMLAQVHAAFGERLSLATLFQGATIESLALQVRRSLKEEDGVVATGARRGHAPRSPLVLIQPDGSLPPFFCVHPVGGTVLCYRGLARQMGKDRPFFGLEAPGVDGEAPPLRSVEAMAAHYLAAVRQRQPRGPYHLGGWSFGGLVAYEMFRRVTADGEEGSLVLIDSWPPGSLGAMEDEIDRSAVLRLLARALGELAGLDFEVSRESLARLGGREEQLAHVVDAARRAGALPPDVGVAELRPLFDVVEANVEARRAYRPPPSAVSLRLVRAQTPLVPPPADPTLGWGAVAGGGVELSFAPGDHYSMLADAHVDRVAALIAPRLEAGLVRP
ncbi:MAG: alpha/beta fold hydrolase, partial [Candidatus Eisenbacteria bacterium]